MTPQVPWSPTAQAFAHHQFSHVANFWKQGRQASFMLEALPGGQARLNLTFQLPQASEVIPPPQVPPVAVTRRPAYPLFPNGSSPQNSGADPFAKNASQKKISSRQRKSYRRSVLHKAALAAPSLPSPKSGSLRQAALASVQRQQTVPVLPVTTQSAKKRTLDSPGASSPSNLPPLAQRIRKDIQVGDFQISEGEVESPERESLRSRLDPDSFPPLNSPHCVQKVPPPAPLVFTPPKSHEGSEMPAEVAEEVFVEKVAAFEGSEEVSAFEDSDVDGEVVGKSELSKLEEVAEMSNVENVVEVGKKGVRCWNCDAQMTPGYQCELQGVKINFVDEERRKTERVKVICDYEAQNWYELTIKKGTLIDHLISPYDDDNNGWWEGKVGEKKGCFPADFVEKV